MLTGEAEALAGRRAAPSLEKRFGGVAGDPVAEARMARVGRRLTDGLPADCCWRFALLDSEQVNAFSLPGGLVYVTRGLYTRIGQDDAMLAAVLAHEISHVLRRDSLKPPCTCADESLTREIEADAGAVALLRAVDYSAEPLDRLLSLTADVQASGWANERRARLASAWQHLPSLAGNMAR